MNEKEVKKRAWVKNAAIIFLIALVILTFFSNTIMNRSLPEVAAQYTTSGTITARIRGSGTVTANESFEVIAKQTRTVSEVRVRLGDEVSTGDVLILLTGSDSEELETAQTELHELELELERLLINTRLDGDFASENRAIQVARNELSEAQRVLSGIPFSEAALNQAQAAYSAAKATADARQLEFDIAEAELDALEPPPPLGIGDPFLYEQAERKLADARIALINASAALTEPQRNYEAQQSYKTDWLAASSSVRQLQQTLEDMIFTLSEAQKAAGVQTSLTSIDLRELRRQIDEKQEEITKLRSESRSAEITSLVSGVVTKINISPGNQTEIDTPLIVIEVVDRGYSLSFPVSAEQSTRVSVGDFADVDRGWWSWGEEITAVLSAIRNDPQNPVVGRLLEFTVRGDIESGTTLNITLAQRSENYNVIVPNSALRSDTNGDFVLVVMSRSSPLGNRYIATRVDVNILASDDTHTAVSGALSGWEFVITTSTSPIDPGMQVRLVDNP